MTVFNNTIFLKENHKGMKTFPNLCFQSVLDKAQVPLKEIGGGIFCAASTLMRQRTLFFSKISPRLYFFW